PGVVEPQVTEPGAAAVRPAVVWSRYAGSMLLHAFFTRCAAGTVLAAAGDAGAAPGTVRDRRPDRLAGAADAVRGGDAGRRPGDLKRLLRRRPLHPLYRRQAGGEGAGQQAGPRGAGTRRHSRDRA